MGTGLELKMVLESPQGIGTQLDYEFTYPEFVKIRELLAKHNPAFSGIVLDKEGSINAEYVGYVSAFSNDSLLEDDNFEPLVFCIWEIIGRFCRIEIDCHFDDSYRDPESFTFNEESYGEISQRKFEDYGLQPDFLESFMKAMALRETGHTILTSSEIVIIKGDFVDEALNTHPYEYKIKNVKNYDPSSGESSRMVIMLERNLKSIPDQYKDFVAKLISKEVDGNP